MVGFQLERLIVMGVDCGGLLVQDGTIFFFHNVYFEVGDNIQVWFWHDIWCGNHSLKELYPGFYACAVDKNPTIHLVMDSQLDRESGTRM